MLFVFNDTATTEIYPYGHILALPDALPIFLVVGVGYPTTDGKQILARRVNDLTPTPVTDPRVAATRQPGVTGGEAARFRRFLTLRLPEFVRSLAPINAPCTTLYGHSLGGLFVVDQLLRAPTTYRQYFAPSPSRPEP